MAKGDKCEICDSDFKVHKFQGVCYCNRHYLQMTRYGEILEETRFDDNKIITHVDYAEIIVKNKKGEKTKFQIDLDDVERCSGYKWYLNSQGYAYTHIDNKGISLHRFIMNIEDSKIFVDHRNRIKSDNRKNNLRLCNCSENNINCKIRIQNTSGHTRVSWDKKSNKWCSYIQVNKRKKNLGYFDDIEMAIKVRKEAEEKYYGEFANNS